MQLSKRQWLLLPFGVVVVVALLWVLVGDVLDRVRLARQRAAMAAAGEPSTFAELVPAAVEPELNAAVLLDEVRGATDAIDLEIAEEIAKLTPEEIGEYEANRPPKSALAILRAAFARHPEVGDSLIAASHCPQFRPALDYDEASEIFWTQFLEELKRQRSAIRVLGEQVTLQLADGDQAGALETSLAMHRLARLTESNPTLVGQLVTFALKGLAARTSHRVLLAGPMSADAHARLEEELARDDSVESFRRMLRGERLRAMDRFDEAIGISAPLAWMLSVFVDESEYIDFINLAIDRAGDPCRNATFDVEAAWRDAGMVTREIAPSITPSLTSLARVQAELRCLRVLNQLMAQDPDGSKGLTIDQLGLPADAILDPFDGNRLLVKHTAEGWTVYSVGQNYQDDDGKLDDLSDVGLGPGSQQPQ